jgi:hypothetical protein
LEQNTGFIVRNNHLSYFVHIEAPERRKATMLIGIDGFGPCFGHASAERGREASWYASQREALEREGEGMAELETKPPSTGPAVLK